MAMKMQVRLFVGCILTASMICLVGCQRDFIASESTLVLDPSATNLQRGAVAPLAALGDEDVLVAVNGRGITKRVFEQLATIRQLSLSEKKDANNYVVHQQMEQWRAGFVKTFVSQRILVDEAFRLGIVTTNEVLSAVGKKIMGAADKVGKTPEQYLAGLGPKREFLQYELGVAYVMDKIIHEKIPPKTAVTPEFLQEVRNQVKAENAHARATNELMRARLQGWKQQIVAGQQDFLKLAKAVSDPDEDNPQDDAGVWGEFEEGELDNAQMAAAIFALKVGALSDVLEDDNGYHLVKVLSVTPAVKNENGRVVARERRKLAHIYLEKVPLLIEEADVVLSRDLKFQMQQQAVNDYVSTVFTNGFHTVVYPHGNRLL